MHLVTHRPSPAIARSEFVSATPSRAAADLNLQELSLLQSFIREAPAGHLNNPDSECRMAVDVLVQLAGKPGVDGANARTALCSIYAESIGAEKRYAILNAAHQCTQLKGLGAGPELSATVTFMAACSPPPPLGDNGPGHVGNRLNELVRMLGREFEGEPNLLALDREPVPVELQAASGKLENLSVQQQPVSMAAPHAARRSFEQVVDGVLTQRTQATVWVSNDAGHFIPVVVEPTADGQIRFHVMSPAGDALGLETARTLEQISHEDCVINHPVADPFPALEHLNANSHDSRGVGGVIQEHVDHLASISEDDREAIKLASQASRLEAVVESRKGNVQPYDVAPSPDPEIVVAMPSRALARARSMEDNFNSLELTRTKSDHLHSAFEGARDVIVLGERSSNPSLNVFQQVKLGADIVNARAAQSTPKKKNFWEPALVFQRDFNANKAPLLFGQVDGPSHPLASVSSALGDFGSAQNALHLAVTKPHEALEACWARSSNLESLRASLELIAQAQDEMLGYTDRAIAQLEKLDDAAWKLQDDEQTQKAKAEAKILIDALKQFRECLTGAGRTDGNVYCDLVAFARQAIQDQSSLERAQALFQGVGRERRMVATPAAAAAAAAAPAPAAVPAPAPEIVVSAETASRVNLQTLARATGFLKHDIGPTTNVWGEMSEIMNLHEATRGAHFFERRKLAGEVEGRLNKVPESNRRLATAVMEASGVPSTLAGSPLWAHLDTVRNAARARRAEELRLDASSGAAVGLPQTVAASILENKALAVAAFPAQLMVRLDLLSKNIAERAAYVTSNDPDDKQHQNFSKSLSELQSYVQGVAKWIDAGIVELDAVLHSTDTAVSRKMKADAATMRAALYRLQATFQDTAGVPQQVLDFTRTALDSADNVQRAADALIV